VSKTLVAAISELTEAIRDLASSTRGDTAGANPEDDNSNGAEAPGVWISADAPEWQAWEAFWRAQNGKSPPRDPRNGWRFPSLTPPDAPTTNADSKH
jgi:hypothetical protein